MSTTHRCVVTGRDNQSRSTVVRDEQVPAGALSCFDFWKTTGSPASLNEDWQRSAKIELEPPSRGTIFRLFEIPPQDTTLSPEEANRAAAAAFAEAGGGHCRVDTRRNAMMHTTATIDYVVLLKGQVTLLLDEGEVQLKPFDAVVQRGTNHYWVNTGREPALLMGVLLGAQ